MDFHFFNEIVFFKKLYVKAFIVIIDDLKVFLFRALPLKACIYGSYVVLKTVFSLMGDWNIVSNSEFFVLFFTQALIFFVLKVSVNVPFFTHFTLLNLKLKHYLMKKIISCGLEKRCLEV